MKILLIACLAVCAARAETYTYWIESCTKKNAECQAADEQLAQWAIEAWQRAGKGSVVFEKSALSKARIRLYWASTGSQGFYGEARAITVEGKPGAEVEIRPGLHALGHKVEGVGRNDRLFRHTIVYLTCLHEIGHALGLPHTRSFADIMYSFEYGGNILEYFGRYRRKLEIRDDIRRTPGLSRDDEKALLAIYSSAKGNGRDGSGPESGAEQRSRRH